MLQLTTPKDAGEIVFTQGRVISVFRTETSQTVGEGLMELGVISPAIYQDLLATEAAGVRGPELFQKAGLAAEPVEEALEELVKRAIYEMFEWDEGTFSFVLEDQPDPWRSFSLGGTRMVAQRGLNPQYLAIEGARVRDERAQQDTLSSFLARDKPRQSAVRPRDEVQSFAAKLREAADLPSAGEDETSEKVIPFPADRVRPSPPASAGAARSARGGAEPAAREEPTEAPPAPAKAAAGSAHALLVVDDDPQVTKRVAASFARRFNKILSAGGVAAALTHIEALGDGLVVASDLIIPRSDGGGILGGIEILEKVSGRSPPIPVVLFTDYENEEAQARAKSLGAGTFLLKPRKAQLQSEGHDGPLMQAFLSALAEQVMPFAAPVSAATAATAPPPSSTPRKEIDPYDLRTAVYADATGIPEGDELPPKLESPEPVGTLRSMLAELVDPANRETVTLLVLRYATLVFERAALFLVTRRVFAGLGGFSVEESSDRFVARVRRINIPLSTDSILAKVLHYRATLRGKLADLPGNRELMTAMGGTWPRGEAAAMALVSGDRVAAVLYGDAPTGKSLGPLDTLEIFLQQAGVVMDRALLERRLDEWRAKADGKE